mmetsp:Transcript_43046/g.48720  ORF Transcript_43046/g.48720 Transcript_43046/m.48720 type:complete len:133 (+) Transcript_43046:461-859(+)
MIHSEYKASADERELLRVVTRRQWNRMHAILRQENAPTFTAAIEEGDYPRSGANVGMMALHFAIRDHAPLEIIKEIYEAYPPALYVRDRIGILPAEDFFPVSPNPPSFSAEEYQAVKTYLQSIVNGAPPEPS